MSIRLLIDMNLSPQLPKHLEAVVVKAMKQYETLLEAGALITVNEDTSRARILPLTR